jgi:hypothetical protein
MVRQYLQVGWTAWNLSGVKIIYENLHFHPSKRAPFHFFFKRLAPLGIKQSGSQLDIGLVTRLVSITDVVVYKVMLKT